MTFQNTPQFNNGIVGDAATGNSELKIGTTGFLGNTVSVNLTGTLTASGNISASGHLAVNDIHANTTSTSTGFRLFASNDDANGPFPIFETTGDHDNVGSARVLIGDTRFADTGCHMEIQPSTSTVRLNDLRLVTTGSIENKSGTPVVTHTASPISSS